MTGNARIFYGWVIVGFTFATQFVTIGLGYYSLGVYLKPLSDALAVDRVDIAWGLSIQSIVVALASPMVGRWYGQHSTRALLSTGAVLLGGSFLLLSQIDQLWQFYLLFGGTVGLAMTLLGVIPSNMLLANWFDLRRGTAMGISQFGITISGTVLVPAVTWIVLQYDWRWAFAACGVGAVLLLVPLIARYAVAAPEEMGLYPDGAQAPPPQPVSADQGDWNLSRTLRNRDIWAITLVTGPCYLGIAAVVLSMPAHITDLGISAQDAATVVAVTTLMGALAKPAFGTLADTISPRTAMAGCIVLQFIGVALLLRADELLLLSIAGGLFGFGYGGVAPLWSVLLAARFGRASLSRIMGAAMAVLLPFNIGALPLTNYIFKVSGSYLPAFTVLLGGYVVAMLALTLVRVGPLRIAPPVQ